MSNNSIQLFEDKAIRTAWDEEKEEWYFSVVDVVGVLTNSENPRRYWSETENGRKSVVRKNRTTENEVI